MATKVSKMPQRKTAIRPLDAILRGEEPVEGLRHLVDGGWLEEGETALRFGKTCGGVVGLAADRESLAWTISGPAGPLESGRIDAAVAPIDGSGTPPADFQACVAQALAEAKRHLPGGRLAGVGMGWPAAIGLDGEPKGDELHDGLRDAGSSRRLPLRSIVRGAMLDAGFDDAMTSAGDGGAPAAIQLVNDADADLLYETRHGVAKGVANALGVRVCGGLGMAIQHEGRLVRGHTGCAGEIQHIQVRFEDATLSGDWHNVADLDALEPCWCGGKACIARFATGSAIVDQLTDYRDSSYRERGHRVEQGGERDVVKAVFGRAGRLLGQALLGPVLAFDPERVVVTAFPFNVHLLRGLRTSLTEGTRACLGPSDIVSASRGCETTAAGAARLVVEQHVVPQIEAVALPGGSPVMRRDLPGWLRLQIPVEAEDVGVWPPRYGADEPELTGA